MTQKELKIDTKEIIAKLARLQADVDYIKSHIKPEHNINKELEEEMKIWEKSSVKDSADFFEKHDL